MTFDQDLFAIEEIFTRFDRSTKFSATGEGKIRTYIFSIVSPNRNFPAKKKSKDKKWPSFYSKQQKVYFSVMFPSDRQLVSTYLVGSKSKQ